MLFLIAFAASVVMCLLLSFILIWAFAVHDGRRYNVALLVLPQLPLFAWAGREMLRALRR